MELSEAKEALDKLDKGRSDLTKGHLVLMDSLCSDLKEEMIYNLIFLMI